MRRRTRKRRISQQPANSFLDDLRSEASQLNLHGVHTPGNVAAVLRRAGDAIDKVLSSLAVDHLDPPGWMRIGLALKPATNATRIAQSIAEREAVRPLCSPRVRQLRSTAVSHKQGRKLHQARRTTVSVHAPSSRQLPFPARTGGAVTMGTPQALARKGPASSFLATRKP